ncbi:phage scaffolding protein [Clostridium coskatii]|uniref:Phage minor structural protein GP20 n=1 Tax=Clostridium coskatii TaxID=1705578 RepID=A0A166SZT2_9CLOT|nr:phage scaffolding protein [Clostridium coskatii]OAA93013.1 Phage minor structural protein GP20 [Clostridium coskatii]OBR90445.1 phage minor structural protein GP20 [Clostridium coskatii]
MPKLNEIIGEEAFKALPEETRNKYKDTDFVDSTGYVEKSKLDTANNSIKDYKKQLKDRDTQLETLTEKAKGNEDLTTEIKRLKEENETATKDYEAKLTKIKLDTAVKEALKQSKVKDIELAMKLINYDNIKLSDDGKVVGINEQIEPMKKEREYLFEKEVPGTGHFETGGAKDRQPTITHLGERLAKQKAAAMTNTEEQNKFFK